MPGSMHAALKNAAEEVIKTQVNEVKRQVSPMPKEMLRMLYWSSDTPPDHPLEIEKKKAAIGAKDAQNLAEVRNKYASILGGKDFTQEQNAPFDKSINKPADSMTMEHHREAQKLGLSSGENERQMEMQKKQKEEEEKLLLGQLKKEAMETPIEAPGKPKTGSMKRTKGNMRVMKKPPVSAETRGSGNHE